MKFFVALGILLLVIVATDAGHSMHNPFFCYTTDPIRSMTNMHAIMTSYEAIRRFNFTTVNPYISTCTPSRFWYLGRYGGRFPLQPTFNNMIGFVNSSIQSDIVSNYGAGRTTLCREDFEAIRNWTIGSNFNIAGLTTEAGIIAMQNIARRYQAIFPDILTESYSADRFLFRHTNTERTNTSTRVFATGLFGEAGSQNVIYEDVPANDWLLRPFDFCPAFREETANWSRQQVAFQQGPEIEEMIEQINRKLGFHTTNRLDFQRILLMWEWCRFEVSSTFELSDSETGEDSAWCAPFSVGHHLLMEYWTDLGHFYISGYGVRNQRLLENMNCGLMQDLLSLMQSEDTTDRTARFYVSYPREIQLMLVTLGAFRDTWPLHQHNYAQQSDRNWLTSLISPLAANLAVVRYDCDDGDHDFIFLLNERPILVPGCDRQTGVCKLSVLVNRFESFIDANCEVFFCSSD